MDRQAVINRLRQNEAALRELGVAHASLFGSHARGDARPDSDTDIMVDLDPDTVRAMADYAGVKDFIADLFDHTVDVVSRKALKPII